MSARPTAHAADPGQRNARAASLLKQEERDYAARRPRSLAAHGRDNAWFDGLPMHWMTDWPMPFPMLMARAEGCRLTDIDGNEMVDLCLGDTGAMFGHAPPPIMEALRECVTRGFTTMLPASDAQEVSQLLMQRFRLPQWQVATTASDANRFALRVARAATGRQRIVVFDGCYHGAVDETLVELRDGVTAGKASLLGNAADPAALCTAVPFNDEAALQQVLSSRDIAAVIAEPVMTNCGMILPQPGFLQFLRDATRRHGTLLLCDETHTLSSGLGGYAATHGLDPDLLVVGKAVGGGVPVSVWGFTDEVAQRFDAARRARKVQGHSGIGTTLSGSVLQLSCLRACLQHLMTPQCYATMNARADDIEAGVRAALQAQGLPWHVSRVGARLEVVFSTQPPRNAAQARAAEDPLLAAVLHLSLLNRGYLLTPFHNMVLTSPTLGADDVEGFITAFAQVLARLTGDPVP
ncbi:MAG: aminotransferase class III-fold pyridoxal phosphate-dependent enzyme [Proteobacteria bacterium]|nr:aminotransferase class III-fold pyridoxal phosphate-dependent enzyme [Pseudomonadota bacterium]